jgi:hypothetical protein
MAEQDNGGQAYPELVAPHTPGVPGFSLRCAEGMTLLDYFAAHSPISLADAKESYCRNKCDGTRTEVEFGAIWDYWASMRYSYAAAMIAEKRRREKTDE